jgi:hypothetical protein
VFINSKNLDHFQWIVALTRVISAVFRKGGDVTFLVDELKAVFDPKGGYWQPGGKFMPSIIAELGYVIERHLQSIGLLKKPELDEHQQQAGEEKRAEFEARDQADRRLFEVAFPRRRAAVRKCSTAAVVMMDGCMTCLNCGDSKCPARGCGANRSQHHGCRPHLDRGGRRSDHPGRRHDLAPAQTRGVPDRSL